MAVCKVLCILVVCFVSVLATYYDELAEERAFEDDIFAERQLAMELRELREKRIKAFECNKQSENCRGLVPCCGSLQCYWKEGYSIKTSGVCVDCVQRNQLCQRDTQCCTGFVCQKDKALYVDGRCDNPRSAGQPCHEKDQCTSKNCVITWKQRLTGQEGTCG